MTFLIFLAVPVLVLLGIGIAVACALPNKRKSVLPALLGGLLLVGMVFASLLVFWKMQSRVASFEYASDAIHYNHDLVQGDADAGVVEAEGAAVSLRQSIAGDPVAETEEEWNAIPEQATPLAEAAPHAPSAPEVPPQDEEHADESHGEAHGEADRHDPYEDALHGNADGGHNHEEHVDVRSQSGHAQQARRENSVPWTIGIAGIYLVTLLTVRFVDGPK